MPLSRPGRWIRAAALAAVVLLAAGPTGASAAAPTSYAALGDSYTSAPLVHPPNGNLLTCLRSDSNYPSIVARHLHIRSFRDLSCSGATTAHMTARQSAHQVPQFTAIKGDEDLVTIGIGFNDAGLGRLLLCPVAGLIALRASCRDRFAPGGNDTILANNNALAPRIAQLLRDVHQRAPTARVLVVGYPQIVPNDGRSCLPILPLSADDNRYLDGLIVKLNAMLARTAAAEDAEYVEQYTRSIGHDMCSPPSRKWWEGLIPTSLASPWHPNASGALATAGAVLDALARPRPAPVLSELLPARRTIKRGRKARLSYRLNREALVTVVVKRRHGGRWTRALRTVKRTGHRGRNALGLSPRRMERSGLYRVTVTAATGRAVSAALHSLVRVT